MLAGHLQGRVLAMLNHMIKPKVVLEIGIYTGYSALCWAEGLPAHGVIHTAEINDELESKIRAFIDRSSNGICIQLHFGNALEIIPQIEGKLDIVSIDADKENYSAYYTQVFDRVVSGGFIIADNVLWSGKIIDYPDNMDCKTRFLDDYSKKVKEDERVENVLFPIRDGLMMARKK
ncbi:MAG: putative O-methyltransferase YrrM [Cellvibrionaceae bacterium]|jgi:predicted O-methyltransferase YrrM